MAAAAAPAVLADPDGTQTTAPSHPARHVKRISPIDKFLKGTVHFFGAQKLLGVDSSLPGDAAHPDAARGEPPNPSSLTKDPTERSGSSEHARAAEEPGRGEVAPPPAQPPLSANNSGAGSRPAGPLFVVPSFIPGAQILNPLLDLPPIAATERTASQALDNIAWSTLVNGVGVVSGYSTVQNALSSVEGVTFQGALDVAATGLSGGWSLLNSSLTDGTLSDVTFSNIPVVNMGTGDVAVPSTIPGFTLSGLSIPPQFFFPIPTGFANMFIAPPPGPAVPPPSGPPGPPITSAAPGFRAMSAASDPTAALNAASGGRGTLTAMSALSSVEGQISGQMVSRLPALSGSPSAYVSRLSQLLKGK